MPADPALLSAAEAGAALARGELGARVGDDVEGGVAAHLPGHEDEVPHAQGRQIAFFAGDVPHRRRNDGLARKRHG